MIYVLQGFRGVDEEMSPGEMEYMPLFYLMQHLHRRGQSLFVVIVCCSYDV